MSEIQGANLRDLFIKSLSPEISPEERQCVTEGLLLMYTNPQSSLDLLQFLMNEPNETIRKAASIGLKKSLSNNWKKVLVTSQFHEPILNALILIFQNETNLLIRHLLVQSIIPIFKTDAGSWPQLFELITNLTNDKSRPDAVEFAIYLISYLVPYIAPAVTSANLGLFLSLCEFAFESNNQDLIDTACGLVAVLVREVDEQEIPLLTPVFSKLLEVYASFLPTEYGQRISNKISFAFVAYAYPFPDEVILSKLFEVVPQNPVLAFGPIHQFIESKGKKLQPLLPNIIQQTLAVATTLFEDAPLEDNSDAMYVLYAIEVCASTMKKRVFFSQLLQSISTNTMQESIISAMAISRVIHNSSESVTKNLSHLSRFFLNILQIPHICAKEIAADSIKEIAPLLEEGHSTIAIQFMTPLIELLNCNEPELLKYVLLALRKLFVCCDIEVNLISPALQGLCRLLQAPAPVPSAIVFDAISSLVFSAGEDVAPFVETLFPLIVQTASMPEENDPNLKANAIEALSNLLRFTNSGDDSINKALSIIVCAGQTNDFDIRGAVMISLSNLLTVNLPQLVNFAEPIHTMISVYINEEIQEDPQVEEPDFDEDGDDEEIERMFSANQSQINSLTNTLLLIKNIYKLYPQLAPQSPLEWYNFSINCMKSITDDLTVAATLASLYIVMKAAADPNPFLTALRENFTNSSAVIVACCFKVITRFLENNIPLNEEIIKFTIDAGRKALAGGLDCQDLDVLASDNSDLTLSMQVNRFFAELATKMPQAFPINEYIDHGKHVEGEFEISQYIGVLRQYYINFGQNMHKIAKSKMIRTFISNLEICNFTVIPEPLIALRNVLERENSIIAQHLGGIISFIQSLFEQENEGQVHYWSTMTNAVSFLCSLMKMNTESFDFNTWLPHILAILPVKGDEMEAEHIYSTLLWLIQNNPNIVGQCSTELIRIFAQTLGLKEKMLTSFNLSQETLQGIVRILVNLLQTIPGGNDILTGSFTDPLSYNRCQARISPQQ
ncbi:hypothetical protein TRFO_26922 [Tritrichomonas foetus]|uniref:Importin N-terminal domain-containing protein n=1 Tax=Tritrichomonas foetus TaxID=1144522 RepID=A0A1J4K2W2_9EUKA|nr:hypothetical protein TRFO_26922 [Tritrichomonas foetus]|eukprot:OHT05306.1 hypothetical protein TRFO_26922 [Tritrichomonas foetus]